MSPFDLNQVSAIPIDDERERDHTDGCSLSSAAPPPNFFDRRVADYNRLVHHLQQDQFHRLVSAGSQGSDGCGKALDLSLWSTGIGGDGEEDEEEEEAPPPEIFRPEKWMPSKMRFMRKMMSSARSTAEGSGQIISSSNSDGGGVVKACSDCNTTKTPLWRSGPRGPKSLCNACGIRQRKERRAMAAAMNGGVVIPPPAAAYKVRKEKKLDIDIDRTLPFKKRCKASTGTATAAATAPVTASTTAAANKKLRFDEALTLSTRTKNSAMMQKVFPQEERDAAILLMTLSCGLIRS